MLQIALLCLLLGSAHSFTVSRNITEKTEESSGLDWGNGGSVLDDGSKGGITDENDWSVSTLLEKANKNLGKNPTDPELRELDIVVGYGLQNADPCTSINCTWPKAKDGKVHVPYIISNQYSQENKSFIKAIMHSFEGGTTCIRFIPRTNQKDYLEVQSDNGCYSSVGRRGGPQVVSLDRDGCLYKGTIQHELLHALGFHHEQSRSDRDLYIKVYPENVKPGMEINFEKFPTNNQHIPYDYGSIMQYGRKAFSKNGKDTMVPKPDPNVPIGLAKEMSKSDILRVNRLYKC